MAEEARILHRLARLGLGMLNPMQGLAALGQLIFNPAALSMLLYLHECILIMTDSFIAQCGKI